MTALYNSRHFSWEVYCSSGHHGTSVEFADVMCNWNMRKVRTDYSVEGWKPKCPSLNAIGSLMISSGKERTSLVKHQNEINLFSSTLMLRSLWRSMVLPLLKLRKCVYNIENEPFNLKEEKLKSIHYLLRKGVISLINMQTGKESNAHLFFLFRALIPFELVIKEWS